MADRVALGMAAFGLGMNAKAERHIESREVQAVLALANGFDPDDAVAQAVRGFGAVFPTMRADREALKAQGVLLIHVVEESFGSVFSGPPRADLDG